MPSGNTARDYSDRLEQARSRDMQIARPGQFNVPKNGIADNKSKNSSQNDEGGNHAERLANARSGGNKSLVNNAQDIAKTATPMGAISLLGQINLIGDMPFVVAMGTALVKDLVDFLAAETVILSIVFSALCSIVIFMMLLLAGSSGKKKGANALIKKGALLVGGGIADSIPGLDFFPIESLTVAAIYVMTLIERKNAQ